MRLEGVFVASITPFDAKGKVAYEALKSHLEWLVREGVHGITPCGTTGEVATLTIDEWREVIRTTRKVVAPHGKRVIAGCGGNCTWEVLERIREAKDLGCDAALVVTPFYNKPTQRGLIAHFEQLADQGGLPLVLYNVPSRTSVHLTLETVTHLFRHPNIIALKEASAQYSHWLGLASTLSLETRSLLAGDDEAFALFLALGGTGTISAAANVAPRAFVELYDHAKRKAWDEAFALQKRLYALVKALFLETNPAPVKHALSKLRRGEPYLRLPLVQVTPETQNAIEAALSLLEMLK